MSKIVDAITAMLRNPDKIDQVMLGTGFNELFFMYNGKYKWSIAERNSEYWLYFYPGQISLGTLAKLEDYNWEDIPMVSYSTRDLDTELGRNAFLQLHELVKDKVYGVDAALNDIIWDGLPPTQIKG